MKLVQSTSGKNQVTSCALEENETDQTEYSKSAKNRGSLNKTNENELFSDFNYFQQTNDPDKSKSGVVLEPMEFLNIKPTKLKQLAKFNLPPIVFRVIL